MAVQAGVDIMGVALAAGRASVADAIQSEPLESPSQLLEAAEHEARAFVQGVGHHRRSSSIVRTLDESGVVLAILHLTMPVAVEEWDVGALRGLVARLSHQVGDIGQCLSAVQ